MPRWLTTPLAASAASFHPSNAAIATGLTSGPSTSLNLMTSPPLEPRAVARDYSLRLHAAWACDLWQAQFRSCSFVFGPLMSTLSKPISGLLIQEATECSIAPRGPVAERVVIAPPVMMQAGPGDPSRPAPAGRRGERRKYGSTRAGGRRDGNPPPGGEILRRPTHCPYAPPD